MRFPMLNSQLSSGLTQIRITASNEKSKSDFPVHWFLSKAEDLITESSEILDIHFFYGEIMYGSHLGKPAICFMHKAYVGKIFFCSIKCNDPETILICLHIRVWRYYHR